MNLFNRSISVNVCLEGKKMLKVNGVFLDSQHELCLTLEVDLDSYTITSADGELRRTPYTDCRQTNELIKKLIGINLQSNVRKQIQAAVGLGNGCTHLTDLTLECVKGLLQAKFQLLLLTMKPAEVHNQVKEQLKGTCLHYKNY